MACECGYTLIKGDSFQVSARLEQGELSMLPITAIAASSPITITSPSHGLPALWRVAFSGVAGLEYLNAEDAIPNDLDFFESTLVDADRFSIPEAYRQGSSFKGFGGVLYRKPVDLTGYTAVLSVWDSDTPDTPVASTAAAGSATVNTAAATVVAILPPSVTSGLVVTGSASFTLDVTSADGIKQTILRGAVNVVSEGSRYCA